jgi:hypothetical protein
MASRGGCFAPCRKSHACLQDGQARWIPASVQIVGPPEIFCRFVVVGIAAIFVAVLVWLNLRLYAAPRGSAERGRIAGDAVAQHRGIGRRSRAGEGADLRKFFPEGWFFSHALYGFAWVNVGLQTSDASLRRRAVEEVRWVLKRMDTPEGLVPFMTDAQVKHGVFYVGWKTACWVDCFC